MSPDLDLPQHWKSFLEAVDKQLEIPVTLHCIGGFVVEAVHEKLRNTGDLDYISIHPRGAFRTLEEIAGQKSELARRHQLYLQIVGVADYPEDYEKRLRELDLGLKMLHLFVLDPYDLVLSKLTRNIGRDREDVKDIAQQHSLSFSIVSKRYEKEMKPWISNADRHHLTLYELWKDFFPR